MKKTVSTILLVVLLTSMLYSAFKIMPAEAAGTIYIRADGSIDPPTAPIQRDGDLYTLTSNITSNADGIVIERDNMTLDGGGYTVQGTGSGIGLSLSGRSNVTIKSMTINAFYYGIWLSSSSGNSVSGNNITDSYSGILLYSSSNYNSISGNTITANNMYGIRLYDSSNYNSISGNNIANNRIGIHLFCSSNNSVSRNSIVANYEFGVYFYGSSSNQIYHNNLVNNTIQAYCEPSPGYYSVDIWDYGYPSGGNYWSDFTGVDIFGGPYQNETGGDMIGDSPHVIDAENIDHYPLMGPWTATGENVTVTHATGVSLIFGNVTDAGVTTVNQTEIGPDPPTGFELATDPPVYYDIKTTANYSGAIKLAIPYNDTGLTQEQENSLSLMHWNETLQQWTNITTLVDTENNIIYGETDSFSLFALVTSTYGPGDINTDGIVDIFDIVIVALEFGHPPPPIVDLRADVNKDGLVDIFDIVIVALHFGETG